MYFQNFQLKAVDNHIIYICMQIMQPNSYPIVISVVSCVEFNAGLFGSNRNELESK